MSQSPAFKLENPSFGKSVNSTKGDDILSALNDDPDDADVVPVVEGPLNSAKTGNMFDGAFSDPVPIDTTNARVGKDGAAGVYEEDGFDDCHGIEKMSAENWSLARRFGFPVSSVGAVADEELNAQPMIIQSLHQAEIQWDTAMKNGGGGSLMAAASDAVCEPLARLARKFGIPSHLRGVIWLTLSGVASRMEENPNFCHSLLKKFGYGNDEAARTIEKDLERTFPEHPFFAAGEPGIERLKNVLHALCWRNPLLTYCQSFNFLAGTLLLFVHEEEAVFWTMCHILEVLMPNDFYGEGLIGLKVDQEVVQVLLKQNCPRLADHFDKLRFDVRALVPAWLMSLYIGVFPIETTIRIWDYFLTHEPRRVSPIPLAVLIAFLKGCQDELLKIGDAGEVHMLLTLLAQKMFDAGKLIRNTHDLVKIISKDLHSVRRSCRQKIMIDLQLQQRKRLAYQDMIKQRQLDQEAAATAAKQEQRDKRANPVVKSPAIIVHRQWDSEELQDVEMNDLSQKRSPVLQSPTRRSPTLGSIRRDSASTPGAVPTLGLLSRPEPVFDDPAGSHVRSPSVSESASSPSPSPKVNPSSSGVHVDPLEELL